MTDQFYFTTPNAQNFDDFPPEKTNLTGNKSTEARLCAVQALYQARLMAEPVPLVSEQFLIYEVGSRKINKKLFKTIMTTLAEGLARFEVMLQNNLQAGWTLERMNSVAIALVLCALAELVAEETTPKGVILNEYINISKGFLTPDETAFINGVLNTMAGLVRG